MKQPVKRTVFKQPTKPKPQTKKQVKQNNKLGLVYMFGSLLVLLGTTLFWSIKSSIIQLSNADQLIYPYLMKNYQTFKAASLPSQHTFLFKWPLFLLVRFLGSSRDDFVVLTVLVVIFCLSIFVLILWRIVRNPIVLGALCLALSSVLLLVPAQPYPGGLLPVNMAMLATRNIEYIVFIVCLYGVIRYKKAPLWQFILAIIGLCILFASDRLFLTISLAGALISLIVYAAIKRWPFVSQSLRWLFVTIGSGIAALIIVWLINVLRITHIIGGGASPYSLALGFHSLTLGVIYSILGLLTNFGANPGFAATTIRSYPTNFFHSLFSLGGIGYLINMAIIVAVLFLAIKLLMSSFKPATKKIKSLSWNTHALVSLWLIYATMAVFISFIVSSHDYVVDARYLTLGLFTGFIVMAVMSKLYAPKLIKYLPAVTIVLLIAVLSSLLGANNSLNKDEAALADFNNQNNTIANILDQHPVSSLIGNYWQVTPSKLASNNKISILPLTNCSDNLTALSSNAWKIDLKNQSFAYILPFKKGLSDYPTCSVTNTLSTYGRPNESILIAGSEGSPEDKLLIYDHGEHKNVTSTSVSPVTTILPISISNLPHTSCNGPTLLNIVAHQDDDILFMNPAISTAIKQGFCVRTVYITAGDGGNSKYYWLSRQLGSEAAYHTMLPNTSKVWVNRTVGLPTGEFVTVANPRASNNYSLIFMNLPDGDLKGQGFAANHFDSIAKLYSGQIKTIKTVDRQSAYTSNQLINALVSIMDTYHPTDINTQSNFESAVFPDHSDHQTVSHYVKEAYTVYEKDQYDNQVVIPIKFYVGYPGRVLPPNVSGQALAQKEITFLAYTAHDKGACQTLVLCQNTHSYNGYLQREYTEPN